MAPLVIVGCNISWTYQRGGSVWTRLSWALGLERAGVDVFVVDQLDLNASAIEPGQERTYANALNVGWFDEIVAQFGLSGRVALIGHDGRALRGPGLDELKELAESADALVNLSGDLRVDAIKNRVRRRILVDTDPGLTHFWLVSGRPAPRIVEHDLYFTVGENVGRPECPIPAAGIRWRHVRQPVLLEHWPATDTPTPWRFTTVATWRGVGPHGRTPESPPTSIDKADEFLRFAQLPRLTDQRFEIVVGESADPEQTQHLVDAGWTVGSAQARAGDPGSFRTYVQDSAAEFSVAKGVYVRTGSGWFSDRTTRYLASGKPALVQDTGFRRTIPVGDGLIAFRTVREAAAGARRIVGDYGHHAAAARQLAEEHFAAPVVLGRFVDEALSAPL
jgi:hypothetical protein